MQRKHPDLEKRVALFREKIRFKGVDLPPEKMWHPKEGYIRVVFRPVKCSKEQWELLGREIQNLALQVGIYFEWFHEWERSHLRARSEGGFHSEYGFGLLLLAKLNGEPVVKGTKGFPDLVRPWSGYCWRPRCLSS